MFGGGEIELGWRGFGQGAQQGQGPRGRLKDAVMEKGIEDRCEEEECGGELGRCMQREVSW